MSMNTTPQALAGLRVVDISTFIAGPFCAVQLGEFGAEVIKLELPGGGDPLRKFGTLTECGDSLPWLSEARNKKSITLDLRKPQGAEIFKRLLANTDVLIENFQPGTLEKWGLGWDVLKAANPKLIMLRISGYGQTGPYKHRPGFGRIGNAFGGLSYLAGFPDQPPVTPGSATLPDYLAGVFGAFGVMVALEALRKTNTGQMIDIGLYEPIFRILDELAPAFHRSGFIRERMGSGTVNVVPHNHYPTADKKWLAIACTSDKIFERLAGAELRDLCGLDLDGRPGLRIAAGTRQALAHGECAEADQRHRRALLERTADAAHHRVKRTAGGRPGDVSLLGDMVDQVGLVHECPLEIRSCRCRSRLHGAGGGCEAIMRPIANQAGSR